MSAVNVRTRRKRQSFSFACRALLLASLPNLKTMGCADVTIGNADPHGV